MSEKQSTALVDDLRPEYDETVLRDGVRGKHYKEYHQGTNLVLLEPDVAKAFPDAETVNNALRLLMKIARSAAYPAPAG